MIDPSCADIPAAMLTEHTLQLTTTKYSLLVYFDTCRLWGTIELFLALNAAISLSSVSLSSCYCPCHKFGYCPYHKLVTLQSLVHCSVPFGSSFLLSLYLIAMDGILCSSSVVSVESCLLPSIWIRPCQVFYTSIVTPPWLLVYKGAHTLTLHKTSSSRLSVSRNTLCLH